MGNAQGCSLGGYCDGLLALVNSCSEGSVFAAMGVHLLALTDVEIILEIDRSNKNA